MTLCGHPIQRISTCRRSGKWADGKCFIHTSDPLADPVRRRWLESKRRHVGQGPVVVNDPQRATERAKRMAAARRSGLTLAEVGAQEDITKARVSQILVAGGYDTYGYPT